jgi:transposase
MTSPRRKKYRSWNPAAYAQLTFAPADRLPEGDLVFFLLDTVPQLDLDAFYASYEVETRGQPPFDPALLVCLLLYAYCVGVYSSRKIALACERNLAFLAIVGDDRPDFRTISAFRKEHLGLLADLFQQVLRLANSLGLLSLGNLAFDGSKFKANAARHKAMSYAYMKKEKARLLAEIEALLQRAEETDAAEDAALGCRRGDELPAELARREGRVETIQAAMQRLEEQAKAEAELERQRRLEAEAQRQRANQKRRGKEPQPVSEEPADKAQTNFTDPEMKIMLQSNKGFDYSGNGQVSVDMLHQIIVACFVTTAANDVEQAVPLAEATRHNLQQAAVAVPTDANGQPKQIPVTADSGFFSAAAATGLQERGFDPYLATKRQKHHTAEDLRASGGTVATAKEQMAAKLRTPQGKALYARRKVIVEPVFGQIKGARGFRQFSLRGLEKVNGEWCLVCLTHNLLKIWRYRCAPSVN